MISTITRARLLVLVIVAALSASPALAQHGTVTYEERVRTEFELPPELQHMRDQIPNETTMQRQLLFDGATSLMRNAPREAEQLETSDRQGTVMFRMGAQTDDRTFIDRDAGLHLEHREFLGRTFLITDSLETVPWRLSGERAEFLGYVALQAVAQTSDTTSVEAWFTPEIPAPVGPGRYGGLPGLILMLTEGNRSFVAQEVVLDAPDPGLLRPPTQGRRVDRQEFASIVEQRMREMGVQGRGRVRYQIQP